MYTTYRVTTDELNDDFLIALKTLFKGKTIEIVVSECDAEYQDETAYLLRNPANQRQLIEAIEHAKHERCKTD